MDQEIRDIPSLPGYGVTVDGQVWSRLNRGPSNPRVQLVTPHWKRKATARVMRRNGRQHYEHVTVIRNGKIVSISVHLLVLEAFVGPRPKGQEARHLNGDPYDNRLENLCWGTKQENSEDKRRHGTLQSCERNGQAKLTREDVDTIRRLRSSTTLLELASQFGVSSSQVKRIVYGKSWVD